MKCNKVCLLTSAILLLSLPGLVLAQQFTVTNTSNKKGIYIEYNATSAVKSFPAGCVSTSGNADCCSFGSKQASALFNINGQANFNIAVGACGSSGVSTQAEFNINTSGACGDRGTVCDWVDASTVQTSAPPLSITPSEGKTPINTGNKNSCGVYRTGTQNCAVPPAGSSAQCYANNFCHNIYKPQNYTVKFQ